MKRKVIETVTGTPAIDGAGVHLVRVLGPNEVERFDPFLMLDAFDSRNPADYIKGFPFHPHRGIETVTYLIKGDIEHQDNLGNKGTIRDGESQWMTAGSGIIHQEMPAAAEHLLGLQLWINMPKEHKMDPPRYFDITSGMIKEFDEENAKIRVVAGRYKDHTGARGQYVDASLLDIEVKPGRSFTMPADKDDNMFVYIVEGSGQFGGDDEKPIPSKTAALLSRDGGFYVRAGGQGIRFILFAGRPLNEPVAWGGPIVMNSRQELNEAFNELNNGTFIKQNK